MGTTPALRTEMLTMRSPRCMQPAPLTEGTALPCTCTMVLHTVSQQVPATEQNFFGISAPPPPRKPSSAFSPTNNNSSLLRSKTHCDSSSTVPVKQMERQKHRTACPCQKIACKAEKGRQTSHYPISTTLGILTGLAEGVASLSSCSEMLSITSYTHGIFPASILQSLRSSLLWCRPL